MEHDIRKVTNSEFFDWRYERIQVDIEKKYVSKLESFLTQFGFLPFSEKGSNMRIREESLNFKGGTVRYFDLTSRNKKVSFEVHQFDDDWFSVSYWENFGDTTEIISYYICDQIESVIHQLNICMKDIPKATGTELKSIELKNQKKEVIDKIGIKIMSFTDFNDLNDFKKLNNI